MTVAEILQFVDNLVFLKTDEHLDDLQTKIIEEVFKGKTYKQIAEIYDYDEGYIGEQSRKLFKILSDSLGENINKSNFCWTLERITHSTNKIINFENNNINFYPHHQSSNQCKNPDQNESFKRSQHDLSLAPPIINFYCRESELKKLSNWIFNQNIRLISVLGLSGIGKTTLVKRWVDLNLDQFDVIIWNSLKFPKSLDLLVNDLLNVAHVRTFPESLKKSLDDQLKQLFNIFTQKRCLIILDDVQTIFIHGKFAGQYQLEYQDYQKFFAMITETEHQSHIILISQEKCPEMYYLDEELYAIQSLELSGLFSKDLLKKTQIKDEKNGLNLINLYQGNPMYVKDIAILIEDIFAGEVSEFLAENNVVITPKMRANFSQLWDRLSLIEQQIIQELSQFNRPVSREELRQNLNRSSIDLINGLQSLQQRYLVSKIKTERILFQLSPIFREYVKNYREFQSLT